MAIKTVTVGSGGSDYEAGWKQLTVKNAKYDTYNGKKFMDVWFEDYPDNLNARVYETINKTTKEEFRISSWFRFANAGIQEVIDNGSGKPVVTMMMTQRISLEQKLMFCFTEKIQVVVNMLVYGVNLLLLRWKQINCHIQKKMSLSGNLVPKEVLVLTNKQKMEKVKRQ